MQIKFAKTLSTLLEEREITLHEVSHSTGIPKSTIHDWTVGALPLKPSSIEKVAKFLKVSVHYLLYGTREEFEMSWRDYLEFMGERKNKEVQVIEDRQLGLFG